MADGYEPFQSEPGAEPTSSPEGVPWARPIALPYARPLRPPGPPPHDMLLLGSSRLAALTDVGILIPSLFIFEVLVTSVIVAYMQGSWNWFEPLDPEMERALQIPVLVIRAFATLLGIGVILALRGQSARSVGLGRSGLPLNFGIGSLTTVAAYALILATMIPLWFLFPEVRKQMEENAEKLMELFPRLTPWGYVGVAMLVGIYEEVLFRGFLMTRLRRATGSWTLAVFISTAIFTALHAIEQTLPALLMITMLSLVFSVITIWRRSIIPAIVAHALFDLSQFLLMYMTAGDSWT